MTALALPTRIWRLQVPFGLGDRRARVVLSLAVQTQRRYEHRTTTAAEAPRARARASATRASATAQQRADDLRTAALAQRLPGF